MLSGDGGPGVGEHSEGASEQVAAELRPDRGSGLGQGRGLEPGAFWG